VLYAVRRDERARRLSLGVEAGFLSYERIYGVRRVEVDRVAPARADETMVNVFLVHIEPGLSPSILMEVGIVP
jgi:hypothetical protein